MKKFLILLIAMLVSSTAYSQVLFDNCENQTQSEALWVPSDTSKIHNADVGGNAHSGDRVWKVDGPFGYYLTTLDTFNILSEPNPYISFWYKGFNGGSYVHLQVSTDGGANWNQVDSWTAANANWTRVQVNINNYKSNLFMMRFYFPAYYTTGNTFIDDILFDNAPTPKTVSMSSATNNGMTISWGTSSAGDFRHYNVQISNSNSSNINSYKGVGDQHTVSGRTETWIKTITDKNQTSLTFHRDSSNYLTFANTTYYVYVFEEDTTDLYNQGTAMVSMGTTFSGTTHNAPTTVNFDGSTPPVWPADMQWDITNEENGESGHSSPNSFSDSPNSESYANNTNSNLYSIWKIPSTMSRPVLKFKQKYAFNTGDKGLLQYSLDNSTWTTIDTYSGSSNNGEWEEREYYVGELKNVNSSTPVYLKFNLQSDGSNINDGWYIDDVSITQGTRSGVSFPLSIDVEDSSSLASKFILGGVKRSNVGGNAHSGDYVIESKGPFYNYLYLGNTMNILTAPNPYISFWYKGVNGGSYVHLQVSTDGGANWNQVDSWTAANANWTRVQVNINNYKSNQFMMRLYFPAYYNTGSTYIDDILIDNAPSPKTVTLSSATNNGMTISWGTSSAGDFRHYNVQISNSNSSNINSYKGVGDQHTVSGRTETWIKTITDKNQTSLTFHRDSSNYLTFANTTYYVYVFEEDTTDLYNQGTAMVSMGTTFSGTTHNAPTTVNFDGSTPPVWPADMPWAIADESNGESGHSSPNSFSDSPGFANYANNSNINLYSIWKIGNTIDRPVLKFKQKYYLNSGDVGYLQYSLNNSTWTTIDKYVSYSEGGVWEEREYYVGELKNVSSSVPVYLRYNLQTDGSTSNDGWYIDDVSIAQSTRNTVSFPLSEDIEDSSSLASKFILGGVKRSNVGGNAHSGDYVIESKGPFYNYLYLGNTMNILTAPNPYISFWYKGVNGGSYVHLQVSTDGGANWNQVDSWTAANANWTRVQVNINNYKSNQFMMRLYFPAYYNTGSTYIDDIFVGNMIRLTSPQTGLTNQSYTTLPFSWTSSTTSSKYHFQLSKQTNFATLEVEDTTLTVPYKTVDSLEPNTTYYWRARGLDQITDFTAYWSFTTRDTSAGYRPTIPYIVSPISGSTGIDTSATLFKWTSVDSANTYRLQVSISLLFDSFVINQNVADTTYTANDLLSSGTTYYWRVRAQGVADTSYYTYPAAFATYGTGGGATISKEVQVTMYMDGQWDGSSHAPIPVSGEIRSGTDLITSTLVKRVHGVVGTSGVVSFDFEDAADGDYWLVVRAGGFLPLGSTSKVTVSTTTSSYNFTDADTKAAGGDRALKELNGVYLLRTGDFNFDRRVSAGDVPYISEPYGKNLRPYVPEP
jgi:hypothetical protein